MERGVVELARHAAAAARAEREARDAPALPLPVGWKYRGVQKRGRKFVAIVWNPYVRRSIWLGSYDTPEEAAHAYDAAARRVLGRWARPNFPDPAARAAAAAAAARAADVAAAEVLTDLAMGRRAQVPAAAHSFMQPAAPRPQAPLFRWVPAPATASQRRQRALQAFPYQRTVIPISQLLYRRGPAAAGASRGAGFFALPLLPDAHAAPQLNRPVRSELSSTERVHASQSRSAAAPERRELPTSPAMAIDPDQSVVGDNFTNDA